MRLAGVACGDAELGDRSDRRQCFAAKAERADAQQILVVEFRGGMAIHREREVVLRHAGAVVGDADAAAGRRRR